MIRHEAIPGFMPSMTMSFEIAGEPVLEDLEVGDRVEGKLEVGGPAGTRLRDLVVTVPALPGEADDAVVEASAVLAPGDVVPDFAMTTQAGQTLRLSDLSGHVIVLTFVYTRCPLPEFCPLQDRKFRALADRLATRPDRAAQVRLLSVSFDPEHDTPEVLSRHARLRGAIPPLWTFAVAAHPELAKIAGPLGMSYGPVQGEIVHTLNTAVIDPEGRLVRLEMGRSWTIESMMGTVLGAARTPRPDR